MLKSEIRYSSFIYFVNSEHFWDDVTRIVFNVLGLSDVANKHLFLLGAENYSSPRKTADISRRHHWRNDVPEKRVQKFHTDWLVVPRENFALTNRKHYPEVGSDTSSVWNFFSRCSDVISPGNQWWRGHTRGRWHGKERLRNPMLLPSKGLNCLQQYFPMELHI